MKPYAHQLKGATWLGERTAACLAFEPRVGKTGTAILALDDIFAAKVLVVTTASGRAVWEQAFADWSKAPATVATCYGKLTPALLAADRVIVSWSTLARDADALGAIAWDVVVVDESHYAKNVSAKRTRALYGKVTPSAKRVWCLTGTPIPNAPDDLFPMLKALAPERLEAQAGMPAVTTAQAFTERYCVTRRRQISPYKSVNVVVGGRNLGELNARLSGFWWRLTQQDVGITAPIYEILPLHVSDRERRRIEAEAPFDVQEVLAAIETGDLRGVDEMHLGTIRRLTGALKAKAVAEAVLDDLAGGVDKVVVMAWHKEVLDELERSLSSVCSVRVDGSTTPTRRVEAQRRFSSDPTCRVFLGQIIACGEAIDLSAAADLIFAESSFVPKDMKQASLRVTNHGQKRQPRVRVAALVGSVDEAIQRILTRKVATIRGVTQDGH